MRQVIFGALLAFGALAVSGSAFAASSPPTIFAPLWVYPTQPRNAPVTVVQQQPTQTVIIREQPSLLTPADLRFTVEDENGVTVVRGPRAR